ncbi:fimbrial protein [Pseudomonas allii]|uniref:Fimbrial protein n=1 Tax=Pseudomonas allii TaxID=2740531 RepID=A0ACC6LCM0_9PSED|nr:fimbrial protein [Pseudomonas allii]MDR9876010.1 fimbrial protein [Pseudomonas allii]
MKIQTLPFLLAITASLATHAVQAATTGTLRFTGQVNAGTCNLAAGDVSRSIVLPTIKISDFDNITYAGERQFDVTADCESDIRNVHFLFTGTPSGGNAGLFANTGTSKGTGLWLVHRTPSAVTIPANGTPAQRTRTVPTSNRKAVLPLSGYYAVSHTTPDVTQGTLVTNVTVSITYN